MVVRRIVAAVVVVGVNVAISSAGISDIASRWESGSTSIELNFILKDDPNCTFEFSDQYRAHKIEYYALTTELCDELFIQVVVSDDWLILGTRVGEKEDVL